MTPISIMRMGRPRFGLVQSATSVNPSGGGSVDYAFTRKSTAGNLLVISAAIYSTNGNAGDYVAVDNKGNTYTKRLESTFNGMHIFVWECFVTSPPDLVVVQDNSGLDQGSYVMNVSEFQGVLSFNNALSSQSTVGAALSAYTFGGPSAPRQLNSLTLSLAAVWAELTNTLLSISATAPAAEPQTLLFDQQSSVGRCAFSGSWKVSRVAGGPSNVTWTAMPNASANSLNAAGFARWFVLP